MIKKQIGMKIRLAFANKQIRNEHLIIKVVVNDDQIEMIHCHGNVRLRIVGVDHKF